MKKLFYAALCTGSLLLIALLLRVDAQEQSDFVAASAHATSDVPLDILVHIQDLGDVRGADNNWIGNRGQERRIELINIKQLDGTESIQLRYMCHIGGVGDTEFMAEGENCGTRGQERRLEGFAIRLVGPEASNFTVTYSCHVQDIGDFGFFSDGGFCGTRGQGRRLEALIIRITRLQ